MDHLQHFHRQLQRYIFLYLVLENISIAAIIWCGLSYTDLNVVFVILAAIIISLGFIFIIVSVITSFLLQPVQALWQAIFHLSPSQHGIASPKIKNITLGREMVESLTAQLYQLIDIAQKSTHDKNDLNGELKHNFVAQNLPLPLFVLDSDQTIKFANEAAAKYLGVLLDDIIGKNVYMVLDMSFPSEDTLDDWLKTATTKKATAINSWERVRLNVHDEQSTLMFDLAGYFNRDNAEHNETMLVLFDHTKQYSQDDQAIGLIALSVHELRTPLTLLRGYIEVFEEELQPKLDPELKDFMLKMKSTTQQLTAFVNNILNVARVDSDQLELHLQEEDWAEVLRRYIEALALRAKVRGITLETHVADNLPHVAVDSLSIGEVINNLVDNAIKYSGSSKVIKIDVHLTSAGLIETTVQDFGLGIASSIISNLFTKFYRDHHNRSQIGGTGLGLYLSKAIITAHGGNVWVRSKENEGSIFGFTLLPYSQLTQEMKESGNQEIVRSAHGWIKNHSLYRK
jgi:two-component system sensor histidine kinase VicK